MKNLYRFSRQTMCVLILLASAFYTSCDSFNLLESPIVLAVEDTSIYPDIFSKTPLNLNEILSSDGVYFNNTGGSHAFLAMQGYSAYRNLIKEERIARDSTILTDKSLDANQTALTWVTGIVKLQLQNSPSPERGRNDDQLFLTQLNVSQNSDVAANSQSRHTATTVESSASLNLTLVGQHITGNIIHGGIRTSLLNNDAAFITNLMGFTTDNLSEGFTRLYFTNERFNSQLSTKSTSDLTEGINLYYTQARFDAAFGGKSTDNLTEGANFYWTNTRFDDRLGLKTTDDITEGTTALYWSNARFDSALSTKSTSSLAEGSNLYYTNARFDSALAGKTTDNLTEGNTRKYSQWGNSTNGVVIASNVGIGAGVTDSLVPLSIQGATDIATLGTEKVVNGTFNGSTSWTLGSGWLYDGTNNEMDYSGVASGVLSQNANEVIGEVYRLTYVVKNYSAGNIVATLGGVTDIARTANGSYTLDLRATSTADLSFTPSVDFVGSLDDVSLRRVDSYAALSRFHNTSGLAAIEIRTGGSSLFNSFVGTNTGKSQLTGGYNTGLGYNVLFSNTTGFYNSGLGTSALFSNTSGTHNTSVGTSSLYYNGVGGYNTAVGSHSLHLNTSGQLNTAIGYSSLYNNTATGNTGLGYQSLYANTTGSNNTAAGLSSLRFNTIGVNNSAYGTSTLYFNTTGGNNSALGWAALYANTTGSSNTGLGSGSLRFNTEGSYNSGTGLYSLYSNTTGNYNVGSGSYTIYANTTGSANTGMGYGALLSSTTASNNTAIGYAALYLNTTGATNTALGYASLYYNTTGLNNTAIGANSLSSNTTGNYNVGIGLEANRYNETGGNNTIIGYQAGRGSAVHNKSGNVFIGYQAGYNETGSNLLYIENSSSATPLIKGDFATDAVTVNGSLAATAGMAIGSYAGVTSAPSGGLIVSGSIGAGASTLSAKIHSLATTEQLRLGYDASNYASFTVSSVGGLTINTSGGTTTIPGNIVNTGLQTGIYGHHTLRNMTWSAVDSQIMYGISYQNQANAAFNQTGTLRGISSSMWPAPPIGVTYSNAVGMYSTAGNVGGAGTISTASGIDSGISSTGGMTTNGYALRILSPYTNSGAGSIGNAYGLYIYAQQATGVTGGYGLYIADATTASMWLGSNDGDQASGIQFGTSRDTNLYRSAANTLRTDDTFIASGGLSIGSGGATITGHLSGTATWDPADIATGAATSTTVTVTGAALGDIVSVGFSSGVPAGMNLTGSVTAADTVTVTLSNLSGANQDLSSGTIRASTTRY